MWTLVLILKFAGVSMAISWNYDDKVLCERAGVSWVWEYTMKYVKNARPGEMVAIPEFICFEGIR